MYKTPRIPNKLFEIDLKQFLNQNSTIDVQRFLLSNKTYEKQQRQWLAEQLIIYGKNKTKLPTFFNAGCWFTLKSFEQSSSEACAVFKKSYLKGNILLDLTGGLGVDDFAFCQSFNKVISIDIDENLNKLVTQNFKLLGFDNFERITSSAEEYLKNNEQHFDAIYIDADRRNEKQKSVLFEDASPDVLKILPFCFKFSNKILLKLSPLVDLKYCEQKLKNVKEIYVVEYQQEVKEVLCLLEHNFSGNAKIKLAFVNNDGSARIYESSVIVKLGSETPKAGHYLFEPAKAFRKAKLCEVYGAELKLSKINKQATFLMGHKPIDDFIGRLYKIVMVDNYTNKSLKQFLQKQQITSANIVSRDFILSANEIEKRYKLTPDKDKNFLIFTTTSEGLKIFIYAERLN
ncbi:MAG: THUMP-like domain-containing protein [Bacteroidia bacterium]